MQAKDLRIDNWFYAVHPVDGLFEMQVRGIAQDGTIETDAYGNTYGTIDCYGDSCKPIPLTEEWLLRFGFEYSTMGIFKIKDFVVVKWEGEDAEFRQWNANSGEPRSTTYIKHVHQLQNLYFALTGKELEIK